MADVQHSSAPVLGMLQNAAHAKDIVHQAHNVISVRHARFRVAEHVLHRCVARLTARARVRQTIDDQFSVLCEAAKLAERMNDAAKARANRSCLLTLALLTPRPPAARRR
jgi:hypothetical protein